MPVFYKSNYAPVAKIIPPADVAAFLKEVAPANDFLKSLKDQFLKYGKLSEKQVDAVKKNMEPKPVLVPLAVGENVAQMENAFLSAKAAGLKRPKLKLDGYVFKPAPANGKNPGAIYVVDANNVYVGMIKDGAYKPSYAADDEVKSDVLAICANPMGAAVAYGKKYGNCACCGKELSDPKSVELGIGPVCAKKYGFI